MNPSDAIELTALAMERWPAPKLEAPQVRRYAEDLAGLDAAEARAALDVLHRQRREFRPSAGEVAYEVAVLSLGAPDWAEVKRALVERYGELQRRSADGGFEWACPVERCDGSGWLDVGDRVAGRCGCYEERKRARRREDLLHPLVNEFFAAGYATWGEVDALCSRVDTTLEAQMRNKWEAFLGRAVADRTMASIESPAGLPRLEEAREADRRRGGIRRGGGFGEVVAGLQPTAEIGSGAE